jgi:hypothetical protein
MVEVKSFIVHLKMPLRDRARGGGVGMQFLFCGRRDAGLARLP